MSGPLMLVRMDESNILLQQAIQFGRFVRGQLLLFIAGQQFVQSRLRREYQ